MRILQALAVAGAALLLSPATVLAQQGTCGVEPGTGCAGSVAMTWSGNVKIGGSITFDLRGVQPACQSPDQQYMLWGACPPFPIPFPGCIWAWPCFLGVDPALIDAIPLPMPSLTIPIPNNTALVGLCLCFQPVCVHTTSTPPCITMSKAVRCCIGR